jgi:hypothetical protein
VKCLVVFLFLLAAATVYADERLGRFSLDARVGAGTSVVTHSSTFDAPGRPLLDVSAELGLAISPGRRLRLVFAPGLVYTSQSFVDPTAATVGSRDVFIVSIPVGVEYDAPIPGVPGLFLYPQLLIGYVANIVALSGDVAFQGGDTSATLHQGIVEATFGIRYAFRNRLELLVEPLSLPLVFGRGSALLLYSGRVGAGARF